MTVDVRSGRMLITDSNGATKLDTNGALFHVTDKFTGSIAIPERSAPSDGYTLIRNSHNLGSCLPQATHVIGSFRVATQSGSAGVPGGRWFSAGGTYLHLIHPYAPTSRSDNAFARHFVHYTFRCQGGQVYLDEVCRLAGVATADFVVYGHTIFYKIKVGLFT